jgi:hypothetical protein
MLSIGNCTSQYLVSRDHPWPEKIRARLDEIVRRELPLALSGAIGEGGAQAPGIWFIRNLDIALDINADWDDDRIAQCWSEGIARSVYKATAGGEAGVLFFPDRAAYLACFLTHLAEGRAPQQWFFEPFSGLSALPASAAIRTAVEEDPDTGWAAGLRLPREDLEKVLAALSESDSRRILAAFGGRTGFRADVLKEEGPLQAAPGRFGPSCRGVLAAIWNVWSAPYRALSETGEAMFHYLAAAREHPEAAGMGLVQAAISLTRLARRLRPDNPSISTLLAALAGGDIATLYTIAGAGDAEALRPLLDATPDWIWEVGRALSAQPHPAASEETAVPGAAIRYTPFGGAFLLLPLLDSLPAPGAAPGWPALDGLAPDVAIRFLILIKCLGRDRSEAAFGDPLLRDLFRIPPALSIRDAAAWQRSIAPRRIAEFHRQILEWQTAGGLRESRTLILEPLPDSDSAVWIDPASGAWIGLGDKNRRGLTRLKILLPPDAVLVCRDETLRRTAGEALTGRAVEDVDEAQRADEELPVRLAQLSEDDAYLDSFPGDSAPKGIDRVLRVAAQNVLRAFARRLPGFSRSGFSYLHRNFLDLTAAVEDQPERRIVRLGKPPLNLILTMAGQNRLSYRAGWLDGRPLELYPQE